MLGGGVAKSLFILEQAAPSQTEVLTLLDRLVPPTSAALSPFHIPQGRLPQGLASYLAAPQWPL